MPDGDIVRCNFAHRYLRPYRVLCSDQFDPGFGAKVVATAIKNTLKESTDNPLQLIQSGIGYFQQITSTTGPINYGELDRAIERLSLQYSGSPRALDLAKKALRQELQAYRNGQGNLDSESTTRRYVMNVYEAEFSHRVPLARKHWNDKSHEVVESRLREMQPRVEQYAEHFAKKAISEGTVANLSLRRIRREPVLKLDDPAY